MPAAQTSLNRSLTLVPDTPLCAAADASWLFYSAPLWFQGGGGREFQRAIPSHPGQRATFFCVHKISQKTVPTRLPSHKWPREQTQSNFIKKKPHTLHKHKWNIIQPWKWKVHGGTRYHAHESWSQETRCKRPHMVWWHSYEISRTGKYIEMESGGLGREENVVQQLNRFPLGMRKVLCKWIQEWLHRIVNVLNATEFFILKWLILSYVNFPSINIHTLITGNLKRGCNFNLLMSLGRFL